MSTPMLSAMPRELALRRLSQGGEGFVERYFDMLKPAAPSTIPNAGFFGLDATDPAFWNIGLSMIEEFIIELEGME